jgi:endonuclease-8
MPEGPSIVILKEAVQQFKGKPVIKATGNAKIDIGRIEGQVIVDFKSWGKQFLICFKDFTVRIHLLMFGSYRINEEKDAAPRLSLRFENGVLNFYTCSVRFIEGDLDSFYDWEADTMSELWNPDKALEALGKLKNTMACDALLDQDIFAGSGNIIKNEVLFRIKVHPETLVGNLPPRKKKELVKETRNYCFDFYEWKKKFELKKHYQVYNRKICPTCGGKITRKHLGKTDRRTFFCEHCQVLIIK